MFFFAKHNADKIKQVSWPDVAQSLPGLESSVLTPAPGNTFNRRVSVSVEGGGEKHFQRVREKAMDF